MSAQHTPGPWKWQGEDYRGGWGWQLLVGPNGEGILCGEDNGQPYANLRAGMPIDPALCKTGFFAHEGSAPCVHIQEADARLIKASPELLADLRDAAAALRRYEVLHRAKGTAESAAKAEVNAELASRFEATIAKATGSTT